MKTPIVLVAVAALASSSAHASLVAYWAFDGATEAERLQESLGTTALDATKVGSGANPWNTRAGFGETLATGGGSTYLSVNNGPGIDFGTGDFSFSIWTYRTADSSTQASGIIDALAAPPVSGIQALYHKDDNVIFRIDDGSGFVAATTASTHYTQNTWQNIIATVDRTNSLLKIYVNGVEDTGGGVDISSLTGSITPDQDLWISTLNGSVPARGRLDDMGFFDHVLLPSEIAAINAGGGTPLGSITFIPEPSSILLLGLGTIAMCRRRR
jgi:hypothetical protein